MNRVIKKIAMLFMVCGLAVSVSFGEYPEDSYWYSDIKAEVKKYEAYIKELGWDNTTCEDDEYHFCYRAKLALLLLEEAAVKYEADKATRKYKGYDPFNKSYADTYKEMIWKDKRFKIFYGYYNQPDVLFSSILKRFEEFYENRGYRKKLIRE